MMFFSMAAGFVCKFFLKILYIFPVKKNKIYFSSYNGAQYSCSPKYLYEYLQKKYPGKYEYVWELKDTSLRHLINGCSCVKPKTLISAYHLLSSRFIIVNTDFSPYIPKRKNQIHIDTWHGGGAYKKVGLDINRGKLFAFLQRLKTARIDYYLSSSSAFTRVQSAAKAVPLSKFVCFGLPRNDIFFTSRPDIVQKVKNAFGLSSETHIVLYAPTYRGDHVFNTHCDVNQIEHLDISMIIKSCAERWGGSWVCLVRSHYYVQRIDHYPDSNRVFNASQYSDMQELLYTADVLLTDYSSCMWDFSLTGKPTFIFAPDIIEYSQERDFYTPVNEWPHPFSKTNEELNTAVISFNEKKYNENIQKHLRDFGSCDTGTACSRTASLIQKLT